MGTRGRHDRLAALAAIALLMACGSPEAAGAVEAPPPETIRLWPAAPPGTEDWTGTQVEIDADLPPVGKVHIVTNVTVPTLTVYRPEPGKANGTAMLVLPGGAFRALAWDLDGTEVAQWLVRRGVTAFVLKYRVRPPAEGTAPATESFDDFYRRTEPARRIALADAQQALRHVRSHAGAFGVAPDRVGMIGFSAGAMTTLSAALVPDPAARPSFAVVGYGAMPSGQVAPADAPPVFVVAAQDDPQVPYGKSVEIYQSWTAVHRPAELHVYEQGGHGFGLRPRRLPLDQWPAALEAWLTAHKLLAAARGSGAAL